MNYEALNQIDKMERIDGPSSPYGYKWRGYEAAVYKGHDPKTGEQCTIKQVFYNKDVPRTYRPLEKEGTYLMQFNRHPNLVGIRKYSRYDSCLRIYSDYMDCDLGKLIKASSNPIPPHLRKIYLQQILSGIAYCHTLFILHRHLEPRFVLVDTKKEMVKISEFGESYRLGDAGVHSRLADPNYGYRAPELILGTRQFSAAADMWAVGCIFAAMVRHEPLFHDHGKGALNELHPIVSLLGRPSAANAWPAVGTNFDNYPEFQHCTAKDLSLESWGYFGIEDTGLDLLRRILRYNPKDRITAKEALKHPYFADSSSETKMIGAARAMKRPADFTITGCSSDTEMDKKRKTEYISGAGDDPAPECCQAMEIDVVSNYGD